ncbi:hypothetical protein HDU76_011903, partial [Blyttiomyces sp. JEL0837]
MTLKDAFSATYKSRPIIRPNDGFARALQDLERDIHNLSEPSLPIFWMSESYAYFMDFLELEQRFGWMKEVCRVREELERELEGREMRGGSRERQSLEVDDEEDGDDGFVEAVE